MIKQTLIHYGWLGIMLGVVWVGFAGAQSLEGRDNIPLIDATIPETVETASFGLG